MLTTPVCFRKCPYCEKPRNNQPKGLWYKHIFACRKKNIHRIEKKRKKNGVRFARLVKQYHHSTRTQRELCRILRS